MTSSSVEITIFTKAAHPYDASPILSKRISLDGLTGRPASDGSACRMGRGTASRCKVAADPAVSLATLISAMPAGQATLALGRLKPGLPDLVQIVTKSREPQNEGSPIRSPLT